jgi:hypothetical protein
MFLKTKKGAGVSGAVGGEFLMVATEGAIPSGDAFASLDGDDTYREPRGCD